MSEETLREQFAQVFVLIGRCIISGQSPRTVVEHDEALFRARHLGLASEDAEEVIAAYVAARAHLWEDINSAMMRRALGAEWRP
jgi:hypothetical protein